MDNQAIIDGIKAKLTKNKESDVSYLETELIVFRTLKNEEVVMALEQLLFNYLSKEEKEAYDEKTHEILSVRYDEYQKCLELLDNNKIDEASVILTRLIKTYEKVENIKIYNYYDFEQMIEYIAFSKSVENARKLNVKRYPEPITYYCYQLANIYLDQNQPLKAKEYLVKALKFNPSSMYVREELIDLELRQNNIEQAIKLCKDSLKIAYTNNQLANLYKSLGRCYSNNNYKLSLACFIASNNFYHQDDVVDLIKQIESTNNILGTSLDLKNILEEQGINYGASKQLINACLDFIEYLKKTRNYDGLKYLYTILYELTGEEIYQQQLEIVFMKEKENEKK